MILRNFVGFGEGSSDSSDSSADCPPLSFALTGGWQCVMTETPPISSPQSAYEPRTLVFILAGKTTM
jgi:hypothetical protein